MNAIKKSIFMCLLIISTYVIHAPPVPRKTVQPLNRNPLATAGRQSTAGRQVASLAATSTRSHTGATSARSTSPSTHTPREDDDRREGVDLSGLPHTPSRPDGTSVGTTDSSEAVSPHVAQPLESPSEIAKDDKGDTASAHSSPTPVGRWTRFKAAIGIKKAKEAVAAAKGTATDSPQPPTPATIPADSPESTTSSGTSASTPLETTAQKWKRRASTVAKAGAIAGGLGALGLAVNNTMEQQSLETEVDSKASEDDMQTNVRNLQANINKKKDL